MGKSADEYRRRALQCAELARNVRPEDRAQIMDIAHAWLLLADDAMQNEQSHTNGHDNNANREQ
jgi:hypothetical protein